MLTAYVSEYTADDEAAATVRAVLAQREELYRQAARALSEQIRAAR